MFSYLGFHFEHTKRQCLIDKFDINDACVNNMKIVRCYRLGNRDTSENYNRPIIVRFLNYNDRQMIWVKRMTLSENFASNVEHRRKLLYLILKKSKKSPKYTKSYLRGDKLMVDNAEYSLGDASSPAFPADLDPHTVQHQIQWVMRHIWRIPYYV